MTFKQLRTLTTELWGRAQLSKLAGKTFGGKRDVEEALGYKHELTIQDYRRRFERGGVANQIVKARPEACWRGGPDLIEDEDPTVVTPFEQAVDDLNERCKLWRMLQSGDTLSGIGRFGVVVIGVPGPSNSEVTRATLDQIAYLAPYSEENCQPTEWDLNPQSPRFGKPVMYTLSAVAPRIGNSGAQPRFAAQSYHWTRVLHVCETLLEDSVYGPPRLEAVWNYLDDLEKVVGGGSEATWNLANSGIHFRLDPEVNFGEDTDDAETISAKGTAAMKQLQKEIDLYEHKLKRNLVTRGVEAQRIGSAIADFAANKDAIMSLISATTRIPQRILLGSEQAKLAGKSDRGNWDDQVNERRENYIGPILVRPLMDRLIGWGALPAPKQYEVKWQELRVMDDEAKGAVAVSWAQVNQLMGTVVITPDEIRTHVMGLGELKDQDPAAIAAAMPLKMARKFRLLSREKQRRFLRRPEIRALAGYNPDEPRDKNGEWTSGGGDGGDKSGKDADKVARAKATYKPSTKRVARISDKGEERVRAMTGGKKTDDNAPVDHTVQDGRTLHGVEVKTFVHNSNDKVTMHGSSLARKESWGRKSGAVLHTVVVDLRPGRLNSGHELYYRRGVGSFRLKGMTKVSGAGHLRSLMGLKKR